MSNSKTQQKAPAKHLPSQDQGDDHDTLLPQDSHPSTAQNPATASPEAETQTNRREAVTVAMAGTHRRRRRADTIAVGGDGNPNKVDDDAGAGPSGDESSKHAIREDSTAASSSSSSSSSSQPNVLKEGEASASTNVKSTTMPPTPILIPEIVVTPATPSPLALENVSEEEDAEGEEDVEFDAGLYLGDMKLH